MKRIAERLLLSAVLTAALSLVMVTAQTRSATAQSASPSPSPSPTPSPTPSPSPSPTPTRTDGGSSANSINGLAGQRFNQMITNQVLGSVLLGVNEQINCSDCISAFGSVGSFTAACTAARS